MKKKAFTLTELLVVVVIIGVLSAVVLPKFTKVLQTRKTTEAENIMAAVRNEQEARCMVGRNYVGQNEIGKLASLPKATSKNYTYTLGAQGITATAKDGDYVLQIPSYADGRICCSGDGCEKLNKDYPACNESFLAAIDQSPCEAPIPEEPEVPENQDSVPTDCTPGQTEDVACECGQKSRTCNEDGTWGDWSECPDCCTVPAQKTKTTTQKCGCTSSGTKTATSTFDEESCAWSDWTWGACSEKETECPICTPGEKRNTTCACGVEKGQQCSASGMSWESYDNGTCELTQAEKDTCSCEPKPDTETRNCETGTGTQTREYTCQAGHWVAGEWTGECSEPTCEPEKLALETICTPSEGYPYGCGLLKMKYDCDVSTGKWVRNTSKETCQETTHCYCSYQGEAKVATLGPFQCGPSAECDAARRNAMQQLKEELCYKYPKCDFSTTKHIKGQSPTCYEQCDSFDNNYTLSYKIATCNPIMDSPYPIILQSGYGYTNWGIYCGN